MSGSPVFGSVVGFLARLLVRGRQHLSPWMTLLLGLLGSVVGGVIATASTSATCLTEHHRLACRHRGGSCPRRARPACRLARSPLEAGVVPGSTLRRPSSLAVFAVGRLRGRQSSPTDRIFLVTGD